MNEIESIWFKLLTLFDQSNHLVKEGEWMKEDKYEFYLLKDRFLDLIIKNKPEFLKISLLYVPYFKYSNITKDKAGALMRNDTDKKPFEYYLSLVEPCNQDIELQEKATIELEITFDNRLFCFHIPQNKTIGWNIEMNLLPKKVWISGKEFHRNQFNKIKKEINDLMELIN